jgi:hypothetical protein
VAHAGAAASAAANAGSDESAPPAVNGPTAPDAVTTGSTLVYFAPQDNDANATVVVLYNTTAATQTVVVKGYVAAAPPRRGTSTSGRTMWCICSATV